jgi:hypothetical protein
MSESVMVASRKIFLANRQAAVKLLSIPTSFNKLSPRIHRNADNRAHG